MNFMELAQTINAITAIALILIGSRQLKHFLKRQYQ